MSNLDPSWVMLVQKAPDVLYYVDNVIHKYDLSGLVLDIGCGRRGWLSLLIKSYFNSSVVTFDIDQEKVANARSISRSLGIESNGYVIASAFSLPFKDDVFDRVVGNAILHHLLDDIGMASEEIFRVMKETGLGLFTGEIVASSIIGWLWKKIVLEKIPGEGIATKKRWVHVFETAGFHEIRVLRENLQGYITSLKRGIVYYFAKYIPGEIIVDLFITSATIVFNRARYRNLLH
jgi:SAM-dependent methyltransferase